MRISLLRSINTKLLVALAMSCIAGCASDPTVGYSAVAPYPDDFVSISVPIIENDTFVRDIEFELTDALIKEIEARTSYKVIPQARADSIILGHIRHIELDQLSKSRFTGLGEEVIISVSIDFEWRDLRTDRLLVERRAYTGQGLFLPSAPTGERIELGRMAVVQKLAQDIVGEMRSAW